VLRVKERAPTPYSFDVFCLNSLLNPSRSWECVNFALLMRRYPELLLRSAIRRYQQALPLNIALLGVQDLAKVSFIDLVIIGWPCQGHIQVGRGEGLCDLRSRMF
jgi:site-specific DNA-cytosine methylase